MKGQHEQAADLGKRDIIKMLGIGYVWLKTNFNTLHITYTSLVFMNTKYLRELCQNQDK